MKTLYGLRRVKGNVFDLAILVIILCIAFCAYLSINGTKFS